MNARTNAPLLTLITSALAFGAGCTADTTDDQARFPGASSLAGQLDQERSFDVVDDDAPAGSFVATGIWLEGPTEFTMHLADGVAGVQMTDGQLDLNTLTLDFEGMDHEIPGGAKMDKLSLVLEGPVVLDTDERADAVVASADLTMRLDWWVTTDTTDVALASQDVDALPIELVVVEDGAGLRLDVQLDKAGLAFALDGMFEVEQFEASAVAVSPR